MGRVVGFRIVGFLGVVAESGAIREDADAGSAMPSMGSEAECADDERQRVERDGEAPEKRRS